MNEPITLAPSDLQAAARAGLIPEAAVSPLWQFLAAREGAVLAGPRFGFAHTLYYLGGLLAIGAATLFMTQGFERLGPWALLAIALAYAAGCVAAARALQRRGLQVPAGILATLAVCLAPLATWALQNALGRWPAGGVGGYAKYHTVIDWR